MEKADRILRAFLGYGSLCNFQGIPILIEQGRCVPAGESFPPDCLTLELADGVLLIEKWQPWFREITLEDRQAMEAIRRSHPSALSDFTFPLLYCWRKELGLRMLLGKNFFLIQAPDFYFCPVGDEAAFLPALELLLQTEKQLTLRFCDSAYAQRTQSLFPGRCLAAPCRDDEDYLMDNHVLYTLEGGALSKRRNDLHHYSSLQPLPEVEVLTKETLHHAREVAFQCREEDFQPQEEALANFEALGLQGEGRAAGPFLQGAGTGAGGFAVYRAGLLHPAAGAIPLYQPGRRHGGGRPEAVQAVPPPGADSVLHHHHKGGTSV